MVRQLVVLGAAWIMACSGSKAEIGPPDSGLGGGGSSPPSAGADGGSSTTGGGEVPGYGAEPKSGTASHSPNDGTGACSFPPAPTAPDVASMNDTDYAGSFACGGCFRVKGARGEVTVRVVDRCVECEPGHLDLSDQAFAKVDDLEKGKVAVTYQAVPCPVAGNIEYHFKEGSSRDWTAIQIRNHAVPIAKLEYKRGDAFVELKRVDYNFFIEESGVGEPQGGLVLRVTGANGQVLEDTLGSTIPSGASVPGKSQFR